MYIAHDISWRIIYRFAWKFIVMYFVYSGTICCIYAFTDIKPLLPALPITILGTAVAFYVGFKNNSSYDRLWEARRIWGSIVNLSRTFSSYVLVYIEPRNEADVLAVQTVKRQLILQHLAYINALRVQLRRTPIFKTFNSETARSFVKAHPISENLPTAEELSKFMPAVEAAQFGAKANPATQLLHRQNEIIAELTAKHWVDKFGQVELGRIVANLYDQQGACERIKSFPYPRQYAYFSKIFVIQFIALLPFALLSELQKLGEGYIWLTIPIHIIVSWVFVTMELVGDNSENPFENGLNDVPMSAICRNIEIDLLQMLGDEKVPERLQPVDSILM
jgi:ion channel-forming bestrophin family protein